MLMIMTKCHVKTMRTVKTKMGRMVSLSKRQREEDSGDGRTNIKERNKRP